MGGSLLSMQGPDHTLIEEVWKFEVATAFDFLTYMAQAKKLGMALRNGLKNMLSNCESMYLTPDG